MSEREKPVTISRLERLAVNPVATAQEIVSMAQELLELRPESQTVKELLTSLGYADDVRRVGIYETLRGMHAARGSPPATRPAADSAARLQLALAAIGVVQVTMIGEGASPSGPEVRALERAAAAVRHIYRVEV